MEKDTIIFDMIFTVDSTYNEIKHVELSVVGALDIQENKQDIYVHSVNGI